MSTEALPGDGTARKPPQALEAETAVLGAILLDPDVVSTAIEFLKPEHFYLHTHRKVYQAMLNLYAHSSPADIVTVTAELKRMKELDNVGGQPFLSSLLDTVLTSAHVEEHARLVLEKAVQRQLIQTATEIVHASYDESRRADELVEDAEQRIFEIREAGYRKTFIELKDLLEPEMERVEQAMKEKKLVTGVETGYAELDEKTSGLQSGELIIVAGRPSMGKTAFALNVAVNACTRGDLGVAVFSLEMSTESLVQRLMCSEARVSMHRLRLGMLSPQERASLAAAMGPLTEAKIFINDSPGLSALDIRARARRLVAEQPSVKLLVIDYLQLMEAPGERRRDRNRQQEISDTTRALKAMAKELKLPVIAISQLSRAPETRGGDKRPQLSDLRESGAIEQDADLVLLLYRAEFYNNQDPNLQGKAELHIAKQRNGPLDTIDLTFIGKYMRFENRFVGELPEPPRAGTDEDLLPG